MRMLRIGTNAATFLVLSMAAFLLFMTGHLGLLYRGVLEETSELKKEITVLKRLINQQTQHNADARKENSALTSQLEVLQQKLNVVYPGQKLLTNPRSFDKNIVIVTGGEGSATYWLTYVIAGTKGTHFQAQIINANRTWDSFSTYHHHLWSSGPVSQYEEAQALLPHSIENLFASRPEKNIMVVHRSHPDHGPKNYIDHTGELWELAATVGVGVKMVVVYREPDQCSFSTMQRKFTHTLIDGKPDIMAASKMTEKHLIMLSRQLEVLDPSSFIVLSYADLTGPDEAKRLGQLQRLGDYIGRTADELRAKLKVEETASAKRPPEVDAFLAKFWTTKRKATFQFLIDKAQL